MQIQNGIYTLTILDLEDPDQQGTSPYLLTKQANDHIIQVLKSVGIELDRPTGLEVGLKASLDHQQHIQNGRLRTTNEHPTEFRFYIQ